MHTSKAEGDGILGSIAGGSERAHNRRRRRAVSRLESHRLYPAGQGPAKSAGFEAHELPEEVAQFRAMKEAALWQILFDAFCVGY
jgi:hypothetical protein